MGLREGQVHGRRFGFIQRAQQQYIVQAEIIRNKMKEEVNSLLKLCEERKVRFPKTWADDEEGKKAKMKAAFDVLMLSKNDDGQVDVDAALEKLIEKFGAEEDPGEKRKADSEPEIVEVEDDGDDGDSPSKKKPKKSKKTPPEEQKSNQYAVEENRAFGEVLKEIAKTYYSSADPGEKRKGGIFSKAAKAFREAENHITNKKEAMALVGVGKGIAGYLEEFREKGFVEKLEKMRSGET